MERSQIPPLQSLTLRPRPLNTHAIAWSSDAELAVATDECIHLYLPHYPSPRRPGNGPPASVGVPLPQFTLTTRISSKIKPSVDVNRQLFAFAGVKLPARDGLEGFGGAGPAMERGAGMYQVARVEWSPSGVGCNLRPILLALMTNGLLFAFGEHIDHEEVAQIGLRSRTVKTWKILWGLGGALPVPDPEETKLYRFMDERITSFSWAKEIASGRALLAYRTEDRDVVIMSVQFGANTGEVKEGGLQEGWSIQEVARFQANGPHTDLDDATDPDFVPSGTAFSLKWSPWVIEGQTRTATLAYVAPNYVGFRRISLAEEWRRGEQPNLEVEGTDTISSCVFLSSDSFIEFEDNVWRSETGGLSARGYIGTPSELKPFEVNLTGPVEPPVAQHSTVECSTAYPDQDGPSNPIAGLIIHPPSSDAKPSLPLYTAVHLSATGTNQDWFETNLPHDTSKVPSWAERIRKNTTMLLPRATIMGGLEPQSDSDDMDNEAEGEEVPEKLEHPYRFRIWGLAASPGGSSTAVVVSKYSSLYPHRQGICSVYFGREPLTNLDITALTTEGKMWEWMHANGPGVRGVTEFDEIKTEEGHVAWNHLGNGQSNTSDLRSLFADVLPKQICMFCDGKLTTTGDSAFCENGHAWSACVATGLAIMEPGISHVCAVCGMRCLRRSELEELAREHLGAEVTVPKGSEACESCGGKFVA